MGNSQGALLRKRSSDIEACGHAEVLATAAGPLSRKRPRTSRLFLSISWRSWL
ncbi:MAG: hypothetical protein M0Q43_06785 [Methanothrix sp.]|nr:hypothetical protein [Methanothrix sp.]